MIADLHRMPLLAAAGSMLALAFVLGPRPAAAQDNASLNQLLNRLDRMERNLRTLNREVYRGEKPPPASAESGSAAAGAAAPGGASNQAYAVRFEEKLTQFEAELRDMTSQVEDYGHKLREVTERLDKLVSDVDFRLSALEARAGGAKAAGGASIAPGAIAPRPPAGPPKVTAAPHAAGVQQVGPATGGPVTGTGAGGARTLGTISQRDLEAVRKGDASAPQGAPAAQAAASTPASQARPAVAPAPQQASAPAGILPKGMPQKQYNFAFSLLRRADYDQAGQAFEEFLAAHPKDKLVPNARYWLGETHYVRGDYRTAANLFLTGYQKDPKGPKAADSLLKLGMSLIGLEQPKDACATFDKLKKEFPDVPANVAKVLAHERSRAKCG